MPTPISNSKLMLCINELARMNYTKKSKEVLSVIFLFVLIISTSIIVTNTPLVYGQTNQTISDNARLTEHTIYSSKECLRRRFGPCREDVR